MIAIAAGEPLSRVPPARSTKTLAREIEAARPRRCAARFTRARCGSCRTRQNLSERDAGNVTKTARHFHRSLAILWAERKRRPLAGRSKEAPAGGSSIAPTRSGGTRDRVQSRDRLRRHPTRRAVIATPACNDGGPEGECLRRATQYECTSAWYQFCFCDIVSRVRMSMHGVGMFNESQFLQRTTWPRKRRRQRRPRRQLPRRWQRRLQRKRSSRIST
ncbi:hypothetical protein GGD61_006490 [Bradyrhizobium sp. SBR1B]|nr:hypothetical protein [Bradyrhizobium sp. SBR1B]